MNLEDLVTRAAVTARRTVLKTVAALPAMSIAAALPGAAAQPAPARADDRPLGRGEAIGVKPIHSAEDYWAIRQTLARHARLFDDGKLAEAHALAPLPGGPENIILHADGAPLTQTLVTNPLVTPEGPGQAWVESYFAVFQATPTLPLQPVLAGYHHDRFLRQNGVWRIAVRRTEVRLRGDLSQHLKDPAGASSLPMSDRLLGEFEKGPTPEPLAASPLKPIDLFAIESVLADHTYFIDYGKPDEAARFLRPGREASNVIIYPDGTPRTSTLVTNFVITPAVTDKAAVESSYGIFQATPSLPLQAIMMGVYRDTFVRSGVSWRIAERRDMVRLTGDVSQHLKNP